LLVWYDRNQFYLAVIEDLAELLRDDVDDRLGVCATAVLDRHNLTIGRGDLIGTNAERRPE
jgi:hypothetical protein